MARNDYFSDNPTSGLKRTAIRGSVVTIATQAMKIVFGVLTISVLARLLQPEDFGLVGMVTVFTGLAALLVDAGLSTATIQRKQITHAQVSTLFWIAAGLGVAIAALVAAASPLIAIFYGEQRLQPISAALGLSFVASGLTVQHQALLRRSMRFTTLAVIDLSSFLLSQFAAIVWAWWCFEAESDYWALVLMPIVAAAVRMLLTWAATGWTPGWASRDPDTLPMLRFGANLGGGQLFNYFARNADNLLIGWWWGATPLGYYERAYKLFLTPIQSVNGPLASVMVPALSRQADDPVRMRANYLLVLTPCLLVLSPAVVAVAVTAEWWVEWLLGNGWEPVGPILRWLSIVGILQPFTSSTGWLFIARGRTDLMLRVMVINSLVTVASFLLGLPWGPNGVAMSYALLGVGVRVPFLLYWLDYHQIIEARRVLTVVAQTAPATLAVGLANMLWVLNAGESALGPRLLICVLLSALTWAIVVVSQPNSRRVLTGVSSAVNEALRRKTATPLP